MRWNLLILLFIIQSAIFAQDSLIVVSYNVENLFDCQHDTLKDDYSFLPDGMHHWSYYRYYNKLDRIAQVIVNIGGWGTAAMVGLCEVENERCLKDLCYRLKRLHYKYVHYESGDERGIDVALLYDSTKVNVLNSKSLRVPIGSDATRDILFVETLVGGQDTLYAMMCHLPSKLGGAAATEWKREAAKQVIQQQVDSILEVDLNASIVVMGDMNTEPKDDLQGMNNMMIGWERVGMGTHKYQGMWSCLDQIYVSDVLKSRARATIFSPSWLLEEDTKYLNYQPKRTYLGYRYKGGYSDHLPVVLKIAEVVD